LPATLHGVVFDIFVRAVRQASSRTGFHHALDVALLAQAV
jgi:hypothetical protein